MILPLNSVLSSESQLHPQVAPATGMGEVIEYPQFLDG